MAFSKDWTDRIGRRIKLRDLHIFQAVAEAGSMGRAATELHVSQPVVSKAVSELERELGVRLLDRSAKGVELTAYGREVVNCGNAVFDSLRSGVRAVESLADPAAGQLRIGCTEPLAAGFVGAAIERLSQSYPRASFHVVTADPFSLRDRELHERSIDLAIAPTERMSSDPETEIEMLFDDRQVILVGAASRWARRRAVKLADLWEGRWFMPPADSVIGAHIAESFRSQGVVPPQASIASFSVPLCLRMVARANFLALLPISMLADGEHLDLRRICIDAPAVPRPTGILTIRNRALSALAKKFVEVARELAPKVSADTTPRA
jgi:DNA-binding transcriptional LysR family regulator